jgi:hypothetical protein
MIKEYIYSKAINIIKNNPIIVIGVVVGWYIGSFFANIVDWIPLIGGIFGFMVTLVFAIGGSIGVYVYLKNR